MSGEAAPQCRMYVGSRRGWSGLRVGPRAGRRLGLATSARPRCSRWQRTGSAPSSPAWTERDRSPTRSGSYVDCGVDECHASVSPASGLAGSERGRAGRRWIGERGEPVWRQDYLSRGGRSPWLAFRPTDVRQSPLALWFCEFCRGVAQPGSALRSGRKGRRFKSSRPDQTELVRAARSYSFYRG